MRNVLKLVNIPRYRVLPLSRFKSSRLPISQGAVELALDRMDRFKEQL